MEARRFAEAVAVLDLVPESGQVATTRTLRLVSLIELRRWDDALPLLTPESDVHPQTQAWAASKLFPSGRRSVAREIFRRVCPKMPAAERRNGEAYLR